MYHSFHRNTQTFLTLVIRNVSWGPNKHIKIISKGQLKTEVMAAETLPTQE